MTTPNSNPSTSVPSSLLLFTTSQSALPVRYPHPHKPRLVIPPLVHRSLHLALDSASGSGSGASGSGSSSPSKRNYHLSGSDADAGTGGRKLIIPHPDLITKHDLPAPSEAETKGTGAEAKTSIDTNTNTDNDPVSQVSDAELTVKLHLVAPGSAEERAAWVDEALDVLSTYKGLGGSASWSASASGSGLGSGSGSAVDTLLIGFKGVDYKGKRTAASEFFGCGAEGMDGGGGGEEAGQEAEDDVAAIWNLVRGKQQQGVKVGKLGTLYLPLGVLRRLVADADANAKGQDQAGPKVNMLDTPDCHHLPHDYADFAKEQGIELWAGGGGEGADPLPDADLHNLLHEFAPLLNLGGPIPDLIPLRPDELKYDLAAKNSTPGVGVAVKWVLGYTVLSKARNVVVDKGYVVSADVKA